MSYIRLKLPLPPSVNWLYAGKVRRYKSDKYKTWLQLAKIELNKQETYKIEGWEWLEVKYGFYTPIYNKDGSKKIKDTFNFEKALSDFLADNIEWFQDHHIKKWEVEKFHSEEEYVLIFIKEIDEKMQRLQET